MAQPSEWLLYFQATEWNPDPQTVVSTLNVLVTPQLLETGAECTASNSLGSNTTIIVLKLGESWYPAENGRGVPRLGH